ncbi:family S53 protease-like protein [Mycena metata]|uniref:tripeptidyl-peptidase II n=1 Tax=Mycena metata TaxID=1033252 RepID=A0AAD7NJS8_9AGAR|nr:family S53 protease-like protein [Mycena metata]
MGCRALLAFLSILSVASGLSVASERMVVQHSRPSAPAGFVSQGAAPATEIFSFRLALASNNLAGLQQKLVSVSTPGSSEFRQWLSKDEVTSYVQPSAETVAAFNTWASANSITPGATSPHGDWVSISVPVSQANTLFAAKFEVFTHPDIKSNLVRTLSVSLPSELVGHVDVIHPSTDFVRTSPRLASFPTHKGPTPPAKSCDASVDSGRITPTCLQAMYGIPSTPATQRNNTLVVTGFSNFFAEAADLSSFLKQFRPDIPSNTTFSLLSVDGGENPQGPGDGADEPNLDIQYTLGLATGVPIQFLSAGVHNATFEDFAQDALDIITFLEGAEDPPTVVSISYGSREDDFGQVFATKICDALQGLTARGVSVLVASGDQGARGATVNPNATDPCSENNFFPEFPATCPWATAVGATAGIHEKAANFSGGGFSIFFPSTRRQAVSGFLHALPKNFTGTFNKTGRAIPDVAMQGVNYEIVSNNVTESITGTSASTPAFASIIALINDRLIAAGKPVLGFLNPFIYASQSAFTDITVGHNSGLECSATTPAFDATTGWDPLTGVGTPLFDKLLAAALKA